MTSSPPEEPSEFRGKTLSPVSPKPVHIPSPSTIPVLENQMDPIFNDTSTHMGGPLASLPPNAYLDPNSIATSYPTTSTQPHEVDASHTNGVGAGITELSGGDGMLQAASGDRTNDKQAATASIQNPQSSEQTSGFESSELSAPHQITDQSLADISNLSTSAQDAASLAASQPSTTDPSQPPPTANSQEPEASGVNYQALLDNLSVSTPAAAIPAADVISTNIATTTSQPPPPGTVKSPISALPPGANLPPRPPPQEQPSLSTAYDLRTFHPHSQNAALPSSYTNQPAAGFRPPGMYPPPNLNAGAPGASGLPPPPVASFQQPPPSSSSGNQQSPSSAGYRQRDSFDAGRDNRHFDEDTPWGPDVQKKYDDFLENERRYVSEGQWDRFPANSRLFIGGETLSDNRKPRSDGLAGNLPTEKVTKRDLFHVFHRHGTLAQISLKQAYGFVQFLDAEACFRALQAEQGQAVRGRKMHLEISKPQRNQKSQGGGSGGGGGGGGGGGRRSRSPDYGRGMNAPAGTDRYVSGGRPPSPRDRERNRRRNRDDYRPARSPSPRSYRDRRGGRGRSPDRYDPRRRSRSRSPYRGDFRSPRNAGFEDDDLPFPRRDARNVPDVQILILDNLDQAFVAWVEKAFHDRQVRVDSLHLHPRFSEDAVVRRQMLEGVQAICRLTRLSQVSGKVPLQVFDRSGGANNISWNEYQDLDPNVCAELVLRARQTNAAPPTPTQPYYGAAASANFNPTPQTQYGLAPTPQQQAPTMSSTSATGQPDLQNFITQLDEANLRKVLGTMNPHQSLQTPQMGLPQQQQPPHSNINPDLVSMLGNIQPQQLMPAHQQGNHGQLQSQPQQHALAQQNFSAHQLMNMLGAPAQGATPQPPAAGQPHQGQTDVQDLMAQLAKYRRSN
ncbi:MAG: hypothetical protein Q9165_007316 [Trypethelium subeluteriae]